MGWGFGRQGTQVLPGFWGSRSAAVVSDANWGTTWLPAVPEVQAAVEESVEKQQLAETAALAQQALNDLARVKEQCQEKLNNLMRCNGLAPNVYPAPAAILAAAQQTGRLGWTQEATDEHPALRAQAALSISNAVAPSPLELALPAVVPPAPLASLLQPPGLTAGLAAPGSADISVFAAPNPALAAALAQATSAAAATLPAASLAAATPSAGSLATTATTPLEAPRPPSTPQEAGVAPPHVAPSSTAESGTFSSDSAPANSAGSDEMTAPSAGGGGSNVATAPPSTELINLVRAAIQVMLAAQATERVIADACPATTTSTTAIAAVANQPDAEAALLRMLQAMGHGQAAGNGEAILRSSTAAAAEAPADKAGSSNEADSSGSTGEAGGDAGQHFGAPVAGTAAPTRHSEDVLQPLRDLLHLHHKALHNEDPSCIFIVQQINRLGHKFREVLRHHYSQYGEVSRVLVAHSMVKPSRDSSGQQRVRPGGLGLLVMKNGTSVKKVLAAGKEQVVAGCTIRVERFEGPLDRRSLTDDGGLSDTTAGHSDRAGSSAVLSHGTLQTANKKPGSDGSGSSGKCEEGSSALCDRWSSSDSRNGVHRSVDNVETCSGSSDASWGAGTGRTPPKSGQAPVAAVAPAKPGPVGERGIGMTSGKEAQPRGTLGSPAQPRGGTWSAGNGKAAAASAGGAPKQNRCGKGGKGKGKGRGKGRGGAAAHAQG